MLSRKRLCSVSGGSQHDNQNDDGCKETSATHSEPVHTEHGREPLGLNRHDPVNRCERLRQCVQDEADWCPPLHPQGMPHVTVMILRHALAAIEAGQERPHREIHDGANRPEGRIEITHLALEQMVRVHVRHITPLKEHRSLAGPDQHENRNEQNPQPLQVRRDRFGGTPNRYRPAGLGGVLQHDEEERPEADRNRDHEGKQI